MIYTAKRCCLILKVLGTVQCHIFCYNYIHTTLLSDRYAIYESRGKSEQICGSSMILNEGGAKLVAATRIFNLRSINTQNESRFSFTRTRCDVFLVLHRRTLNSAAQCIATNCKK